MMKRKGILTLVTIALSLITSAALALENLPNRTGLSMSVGGESQNFRVRPDGASFTTDMGLVGGYVGINYDNTDQKVNYATGLDIGGASETGEDVHINGKDFSGGTFYVRPTLKAALPVTNILKVGGSASYTYIAKADSKVSGTIGGITGTEKITMGATHLFKITAPAVQVTPVKGLDIYGGFQALFVNPEKAKIELYSPSYGSYSEKFKVDGINTCGGLLGAQYSFGKYGAAIQAGWLANHGSSFNGALTYSF